jgi:hypothetical protein
MLHSLRGDAGCAPQARKKRVVSSVSSHSGTGVDEATRRSIMLVLLVEPRVAVAGREEAMPAAKGKERERAKETVVVGNGMGAERAREREREIGR